MALVSEVKFASTVARNQREALERLLFFNGCQSRVAQQIADAIDRFGPPEIHDDGRHLRVRVAGMPDVQSLFALEAGGERPIGVAVYVRADLEHVTVLHLGVSEEYCAGGMRDDVNLLLRLMKEIRRSSRRLKGVRRLRVLYGAQRLRALA
ncbi:MAG TPA: hypothetical protein VMT50_07810 [Steroidobacteraceae bacterium]|nr:hypothetical protein [Steroidobacteraceae bacterium]